MWRSSITSSIYRLILPLAHKNILQHKRKNMRRNWARNLMLTCLDVYTYLSHFLLSFYYYYSYYYLFFIISRLHTNISSFFFSKHVHTINLFLINLLYIFMHLYLGYTCMHETLSFCYLDIFFENIKMCQLRCTHFGDKIVI